MLIECTEVILVKAAHCTACLPIFQALTGFRSTDERNLPLTKAEDVLALTEKKGRRKGKEKKVIKGIRWSFKSN